MMLSALVLAGCSTASDGTLVRFADSGDSVVGAAVTPLVSSPQSETFAIDPNADSTRTGDEGRFVFGDGSTSSGVQVSIDVPSVEGAAVGRLDWRGAFDPLNPPAVLELPEPQACNVDATCGTELLPDLTPIIGWGDVLPPVKDRLRPATENGDPTAGLFPAETWFVEQVDDRRLLRFATVAANVGEGPLDIIAGEDDGDSLQTWQRIWTDEWRFTDRLSGEFVFHEEHDHIHFDAFERYRLLDDAGNVVAEAEKVSFCLRDSVRIATDSPTPVGPMLVDDGDCGNQQQIINAGFGDHYHALLEDQWIDITGVPDGRYTVEISVDPLDLIVESNESNNVGRFAIELVE